MKFLKGSAPITCPNLCNAEQREVDMLGAANTVTFFEEDATITTSEVGDVTPGLLHT